MVEVKKILLVNPDAMERQNIAGHLRRVGYVVTEADDGAVAINRAIADAPDMIITAVVMAMVDGFKLCQLLRTNPATQAIPFVFITEKDTNPKKLGEFIRPADDFILKPYRIEELLGRVNNLFYRLDKVQEVSAEADRSVAGTLSEIALVDLLQIFKMNRKSGTLALKMEGRAGLVFMRDGAVINARIGKVMGLKAMYRLFTWQHGTFEFKPGPTPVETRISQPTENLIMEGLRQFDEVNRLKDKLPLKNTFLGLKKKFKGHPSKLRPVTREVLGLLEYFTRFEDILDNSSFPDMEVYDTLRSLLEHDIIEVQTEREAAAVGSQGPLFTLEEALKVGYYLGVGQGEPHQTWTGKVLLFTQRPDHLHLFLDRGRMVPELRLEEGQSEDVRIACAVGVRASVAVMENVSLTILSLPSAFGCEPIWHAFRHRALAAIIVGDGDGAAEEQMRPVVRFLREEGIMFAAVAAVTAGTQALPEDGSRSLPWTRLAAAEADFSRKTLRALVSVILSGAPV